MRTLDHGSTGDLGTLTTDISDESLALLASALGTSAGVAASLAIREYARVLWATYEERLAVTTGYRTRILRPLGAGAIQADGFLLSSADDNGRWRLVVLTEIRSGDELVASNRTQLLVTAPAGATRPRGASSRPASAALYGPISSELLSRERIVALEEATGAIWPAHAVDNIHTHSEAAQATGIATQRFASGMLTAGLIVKWLAAADESWCNSYELDVTFLRPAAEGSVLHIGELHSDTGQPSGHRFIGCTTGDALIARATLVPIDAGVPRPGDASPWR